MSEYKNVFVFIEQDEGKIADVSLELLCKARELADILDEEVCAVLLGDAVDSLTETLFQYHANKVYLAQDNSLKIYRTLPYANVITKLVQREKPRIMLYGATHVGRDLAPRIASALKCGLTADCTDLQIGDYTFQKKEYNNLLYQIRPAFGGNIIATIVNPENPPQMATVREGVMRLSPPDPDRTGEIITVEVESSDIDNCVKIIKRFKEETKVDLKKANIIVSGGYGVGSKDNFKLIYDLASALGGEVGASRAAVDAGWISHDHQVGQTGTTVRPKLYIACGISGSVQHRAGMQESSKIMVINTDKDAPIFSVAHYGIVGDLNIVIPQMLKALREKE